VIAVKDRVADAVRRLEVWVAVAALLPIALAVARHSGGRWTPMGDNALVELRGRDVFSLHHFPFLGTWSSASLTAGTDLNHPGPLLFDLVAIPIRLFGGSTGVAVGIGLINAAATVGIAIVGYRLAGRSGSILATLLAAALGHSLGSGMLTDPWNPHALIVPALLMFMLTWAVAAGSFRMFPWLLAVASLCVQTHLGYAYLVPASCLIGLAGCAVVLRRRWREDTGCRPVDVRALRRTSILSIATVLVLWAQPLIEQFTGQGQGNLSRIIRSSSGNDEPVVGARLGVRLLATVVALPPWWSRSSIVDAVPLTPYGPDGVTVSPAGVTGGATAVVALVLLGLVLVGAAVVAHRRRDRPGLIGVVVAACLLAVCLGTLTVMPVGPLGLTPHQMRWLWSMGAFTWFAVALVVVRWIGALVAVRRPRFDLHLAVGLSAVVGVVVAFNLPRYDQLVGPDTFQAGIPVAHELSDQVDDYRTDQAVWLDISDLLYLEPFSAVVMAALERGGIDFRLPEPGLVRQVGDNRQVTGHEPLRMVVHEGRQALDAVDGMERIAFTSPLTSDQIDELLAGEQAMIDEVAVGGIVLTAAGEQAVDNGAFGMTRQQVDDAALDAFGFVYGGLAAEMVAAGALDLTPGTAELFERTSTLRRMVDVTTVSVDVGPATNAVPA
jgi:hypothetical protein